MSGRPPPGSTPQSLRVEVLKELQQLIDNREARDRVDKGPLAETKGREHWILHLMLRAQESSQARVDNLIGSAYSNLTARMQALDDRLARLEEAGGNLGTEVRTRFEQVDQNVGERIDQRFDEGLGKLSAALGKQLGGDLDAKWKPVGESIETFAQGSRQVLKDVADTYRVATQTRLLLNENARRITDLGRDLVALEESLKLVVAKTIEEGLAPLEARVAQLEGQGPVAANGTSTPNPETVEKSPETPDGA
ncbi:MAG: hypothetical protein L3K19_04930 [Thermoplasmata archaeon]|nr:hypothetical protein [Thermoplasmata archaeon]